MTYDPTTSVTDDVSDNLASYHNELKTAIDHMMSASSYASYVRTQSMTANVTLADADFPIQSFSPTAARDLTLPAVASSNHPFYVWNRSGAYAITVKNASAVVIAVLQPYSHVTLQTDGTNGWYVIGTSERETVYKLTPTVASNNLTLTLTHMDGTTPSTSRPLWFKIGDAWRAVTGALSVTVNAAVNTFNAGSAELATKEIDYFPYVSWRAASSAVVMGFSRIPFASLYSDFSGTATNEKYAAFSTAPASTDDVVNIGRFAATLSAGAGYTWTVPTFNSTNLVNRPTFETRLLSFTQVFSNFTVGSATVYGQYRIMGQRCAGRGGAILSSSTMGTAPSFTLPISPSNLGTTYENIGDIVLRDTGTALFEGTLNYVSGNTAYINYKKVNGTAIETAAVAATVPMTWANTDEFYYKFLFEMA